MRRWLSSVPVRSLVRFSDSGYIWRITASDPNCVELTNEIDVSSGRLEQATRIDLRVKTDCPCNVVVFANQTAETIFKNEV
jgi:hypothetical protein